MSIFIYIHLDEHSVASYIVDSNLCSRDVDHNTDTCIKTEDRMHLFQPHKDPCMGETLKE